MKNIRIFSENFQFLVVKFSIYLNRSVCVMLNRPVVFTSVRSKAVVQVLSVLCVTYWLLVLFLCFVPFFVSLLCLVDPV